jgi:hypothetical protein
MCISIRTALFVAAIAILGATTTGAVAAAPQNTQPIPEASPELVDAVAKEIGSSPQQAAGAAGSLFGVAKSRLKPEEFGQVAKAVPGMDGLLKAAPAMGGMSGLSGLAGAAAAFSKLGLKPEMVAKVVPILTSFVTKSGGPEVGRLLASALK